MAIIDPDHPTFSDDPERFWQDEIKNLRFLLYETEKAITYLTKNRMGRYTIDTGQDIQTVHYQDLNSLYVNADALIKRIHKIETFLGINGPQINRVVPRW